MRITLVFQKWYFGKNFEKRSARFAAKFDCKKLRKLVGTFGCDHIFSKFISTFSHDRQIYANDSEIQNMVLTHLHDTFYISGHPKSNCWCWKHYRHNYYKQSKFCASKQNTRATQTHNKYWIRFDSSGAHQVVFYPIIFLTIYLNICLRNIEFPIHYDDDDGR
jgi:hypothetical protein